MWKKKIDPERPSAKNCCLIDIVGGNNDLFPEVNVVDRGFKVFLLFGQMRSINKKLQNCNFLVIFRSFIVVRKMLSFTYY